MLGRHNESISLWLLVHDVLLGGAIIGNTNQLTVYITVIQSFEHGGGSGYELSMAFRWIVRSGLSKCSSFRLCNTHAQREHIAKGLDARHKEVLSTTRHDKVEWQLQTLTLRLRIRSLELASVVSIRADDRVEARHNRILSGREGGCVSPA
jgi:hypothetical protein